MESREQHPLERDPRPAPRIRAPLFDRLTKSSDPADEAAHPCRSLSAKEAIEAVQTELSRILNSRTTLQADPRTSGMLTTVNYGLPDFSHVSALDMQARADLASRLANIIEAFEPRLSQVRVTIQAHRSGERFLAGSIEAVLRMGMIPEPVAFELYSDEMVGGFSVKPLSESF